jgi:tetratricopeptide (TPR) repeat protein
MSLFTRAGFFRKAIASLTFAAMLALGAVAVRAQDPTKPPPPPPPPSSQSQPPAQSQSAGESSSKSGTSDALGATGLGAAPPPPPTKGAGLPGDAEALPAFEPLEAKKDCEVGSFYMKQGKYDAAIDRFIDATHAMPTYAMPWQLMGEAYEKKGDFENSIKSYQKFLKLYPSAPDHKRLEDHIAELQKKLEKDTQKRSGK